MKQIKSLAKSFQYAFHGLWYCVYYGRNMRIHIVVGLFVLLFSKFYAFSSLERVVLYAIIAVALVLESVNTAVECVVDLLSPEYNKLAGIAKDVIASAVLLWSIFAVVAGFVLFYDLTVLGQIVYYFTTHLYMLIAVLVLIVLSLLFIFKLPHEKKEKDGTR